MEQTNAPTSIGPNQVRKQSFSPSWMVTPSAAPSATTGGGDTAAAPAQAETVDAPRVAIDTDRLGGSISAEHGIGRLKRASLAHYGDPVKLDLMRRMKAALDPQGIMNPGKIFD